MSLLLILSELITDCWTSVTSSGNYTTTSIFTDTDGLVGTLGCLMLNFFFLMMTTRIMIFFVESLVSSDDWIELDESEASQSSESTGDVQQSETTSENPEGPEEFLMTEANKSDLQTFLTMFYRNLQGHVILAYNPKTKLDERYVFNMRKFEYEQKSEASPETEKKEMWDFENCTFIIG